MNGHIIRFKVFSLVFMGPVTGGPKKDALEHNSFPRCKYYNSLKALGKGISRPHCPSHLSSPRDTRSPKGAFLLIKATLRLGISLIWLDGS